jgi:putative glutamine amidotransferase
MIQDRRPRVAIVGRFSESASAIRYRAVLSARELLELVWAAGGEPIQYLPTGTRDWQVELSEIDAVILPGGGDLDPALYGGTLGPEIYDVNNLQDAEDLELARRALEAELPVLGICRGMHVLNVLRGGTLTEHMDEPHRHVLQSIQVPVEAGLGLSGVVEISCYHHQSIKEPGSGVEITAVAGDGTFEAVSLRSGGWCKGVQWHPEDTWRTDPRQLLLMQTFIHQSSG